VHISELLMHRAHQTPSQRVRILAMRPLFPKWHHPGMTEADCDKPVQLERRQGVLALSLNRPKCLNAINNEMCRQIVAALEEAALDQGVKSILIRGNGRAFCAGRDISEPPTDQDLNLVQAVATALVRIPKPVVAAVHGWTVGAGLEWMLDADIVVAAASTRFKLPEASLGVFVTGAISAILPAAVGLSRAKAIMLLGEPFNAQQAAEWGLVWKVTDDANLDAVAWEMASALATLEPAVAAEFKSVLNKLGLSAFDQAVAEESRAQRALSVARVT
jgi:2-(1,2-epoxy-1,2-dihydrophenyl)acetyl-CoA isomerase